MENPETRYRLRWNEKVVGYTKKIHTILFYSTDNYAWSGNPIEYNLKDPFTGLFDLNRRAIFAEDIIEFREFTDIQYAFVLYDEVLNEFHLLSIDGEELLSKDIINYLTEKRFVWKSYRFIQNHL